GAQEAVARATAAQKALEDAERARTEARIQADAIVIDTSDERAFASVGITGGGGVFMLDPGNLASAAGGGSFGLQAQAHVGFWQVAPAHGLANGFELRALARLWGTAATAPVFTIEGLVTARYYFGFFGVGVAGDFRFLNWSTPTQLAQSRSLIGVGPSLSVAFVDNATTRIALGAHWTPLISSDWGRVTGDFELSYKLFTLSIVGGRSSDGPFDANQRAGYFIGAFAGIRYAW
ncbi:MAG: hypothetical protein ACOZQL_07855, partial [Myxococcota bacterium]